MDRHYESYWQRPRGNPWLCSRIPWALFAIFVMVQIQWDFTGWWQNFRESCSRQAEIVRSFTPEQETAIYQLLQAKVKRAEALGGKYTPALCGQDIAELVERREGTPASSRAYEVLSGHIGSLKAICLLHFDQVEIEQATLEALGGPLISNEGIVAAMRWLGREHLLFIPLALVITLLKLIGLASESRRRAERSGIARVPGVRQEVLGEIVYNWMTILLASACGPLGILTYPENVMALTNARHRALGNLKWERARGLGTSSWRAPDLTPEETARVQAEVLAPVQAIEAWFDFVISLFQLEPVSWRQPVLTAQRIGAAGFLFAAGTIMILCGNIRIARADSLTAIHTVEADGGSPSTCLRLELLEGRDDRTIWRVTTDEKLGFLKLSGGHKTGAGQKYLIEFTGPVSTGWEPKEVSLSWYDFTPGEPSQLILLSPRYDWRADEAKLLAYGEWKWPLGHGWSVGALLSTFFEEDSAPSLTWGPVASTSIGDTSLSLYGYFPGKQVEAWLTVPLR